MNSVLKFVGCLLITVLLAGLGNAQSDSPKRVPDPNAAEISVRCVDTSGQPVSPETVLFYNGGRAKTIELVDGTGVAPSDTGVVVAKAAGFQFTGAIVSGKDVDVVFQRDDEPYEPLSQTAFPMTDQLREKVAESIKENLWPKVEGADAKSSETLETAQVLATVDPVKVLQWLDENKLPEEMSSNVSYPALTALLRVDPEEAFDRCSQIKHPIFRSGVLMFLLASLEEGDAARATVEAQLLEASRVVKQPGFRLAMRAALGEHYLVTGRVELVERIVKEHIDEVKKLPTAGWSAFPRSLFAALVVEKDPKLAQELIEDNSDRYESNRACQRVAFYCCRTNPELASQLLTRYDRKKNLIRRWETEIKICHRMALEQTAAAKKLAESIDELNQQAWALGLMAQRLNESDPAMAKKLILEAIDACSQPEARHQQWYHLGETLAGLLPIVQDVDPAKVRPLVWQAVFEAVPRSRWVVGTSNKVKVQAVAGAIARYDLELGRALVGDGELEIGKYTDLTARHALLTPSKLTDYLTKLCALDPVDRNSSFDDLMQFVTQGESDFWKSVSEPQELTWPTETFEALPGT